MNIREYLQIPEEAEVKIAQTSRRQRIYNGYDPGTEPYESGEFLKRLDISFGDKLTPKDRKTVKPYSRWVFAQEINYFLGDAPPLADYYDVKHWVSSTTEISICRTKAYNKMQDAIQSNGIQGLMNLATADKTYGTIIHNTHTLYRSMRAFKKGNVTEALKIALSGRSKRQGRSIRTTATDRYLEYTYAISPLIQEIIRAYHILRDNVEIPTRLDVWERVSTADYEQPSSYYRDWDCVTRCRMTFKGYVKDPNAYLCSVLGLNNPLLAINDVIPYSFVVNWFTNHEQWLQNLGMWSGLQVDQCYRTTKSTSLYALSYQKWLGKYQDIPKQCHKRVFMYYFEREASVPAPTLQEQQALFDKLSQRRILSAVALVSALKRTPINMRKLRADSKYRAIVKPMLSKEQRAIHEQYASPRDEYLLHRQIMRELSRKSRKKRPKQKKHVNNLNKQRIQK